VDGGADVATCAGECAVFGAVDDVVEFVSLVFGGGGGECDEVG